MTKQPPFQCSNPWCANGAERGGKCRACRLEVQAERTAERASPEERGYGPAWRRFRKWFIARNPLCGHCEKEGLTRLARELDHIKPLDEGGALLDAENVQGLCHRHHRIKTEQDKRRRAQTAGSIQHGATDHHR